MICSRCKERESTAFYNKQEVCGDCYTMLRHFDKRLKCHEKKSKQEKILEVTNVD